MTISSERVTELVGAFSRQRILVIGDLMLDRYVYGSVSRISPEAPVPVVLVDHEKSMPGGACNVASNVASLGGGASVCGVVGDDWAAGELKRVLGEDGVSTEPIQVHGGCQTAVKTRVVAGRQQLLRVDREDRSFPPEEVLDALCAKVEQAVGEATGLVIEDYGKGVVEQRLVDVALKAARKAGIPSGFDPKENHTLEVPGVTVATPNRREAFLAAGMEDRNPEGALDNDELLEAARILFERWGPDMMLITLGPGGMLLVRGGDPLLHVPTQAREVFDVSGAGDTVMATCLLALAAGATEEEAAHLANHAAGVVVAKLGTATCSAEELIAAAKD